MMEWTDENNKTTINGLLDYYADLLAGYRGFALQNLDADLATKLKSLQTLKSIATTIDALLKRWSFAYRGYDGNAHQAREDANSAVSERTSLTDGETDENVQNGGYSGQEVELKIILRELPDLEDTAEEIDGETLSLPPEPLPEAPVKKMKKETVAAEISKVLDAGEQTTAAIADAIGRSERSVRRDLTALRSDSKVSLVKKGVYRLHRSVKWTESDNRVLINELLGVYTALIDACKGDVKEIFGLQDLSNTEKLLHIKTFNSCVATIDRLMKRWSLVHVGWNTNPQLAKADAEAKTSHTEKVDLAGAPLEAFFQVVADYGAGMKEIFWNLPKPLKSPDDEVGTWAYDETTQELYPPGRDKPIREAEARKRLLNRKTPGRAALILFG